MAPDTERPDEELEEERHVKTDKRVSREAGEDEPPAEAQDEAEPDTEEEAAEGDAEEQEPAEGDAAEDMPELDVYSLLRMSIGMYAQQAWVHMGLRADPNTQKVQENLPLAGIAIDTAAFMAEKLQPDLTDDEKREIEQLLANLRINYVQRT